jgi:hypothetical protein
MLKTQVQILESWRRAQEAALPTSMHDRESDRGEVTAQTAMIALLVIAAVAAGTIIASRITGNANKIPTP